MLQCGSSWHLFGICASTTRGKSARRSFVFGWRIPGADSEWQKCGTSQKRGNRAR